MLSRRIIPCLDVKEGRVVKGVQFKNHRDVGSIEDYACFYRDSGADELVFYDITASCEGRTADHAWVSRVSRCLDIPFCVAGGIRSVEQARLLLQAGADKVSINSPALERPLLIRELADAFGSQSIVVGIDSFREGGDYRVYQYTGSIDTIQATSRNTLDWVREVQDYGAGEIVLNCMNRDGMKTGYDVNQLREIREVCKVSLIASGGAGSREDFLSVFETAQVDGALAASIFHDKRLCINDLKSYLQTNKIIIRAGVV